MRLKSSEPISEVLRLVESGIVDADKYKKIAESFPATSTSFRLFDMTLEQYQGFLDVSNDDIKAVEYGWPMSSYKDYKKRVLKDPKVKAEYDTERVIS